MVNITKAQFILSSFWKIIEQYSTKGVSLVFSIILARMLDPSDYGLIVLTVVFTNLSDILIDGGFSTALIRKKDVDDYDFSSVWLISMTISIILYIVIFALAPTVSSFYGEAELTPVLRVIGLILFIQAFSSVRIAFISRNMQFKLLFRCNIIGTLVSGILGVIAAYIGFGVWALVIQRLMQQFIQTLLLLINLKWKLRFQFNFDRIKEMLKFSIGVVSSSLIYYLSSSLYSLIVGKKYSVESLGYFDKGAQLPTQVSLYTFGAMSSVLLPTLASYQSDLNRVKQIVRKVVQMTGYFIAPMMVGLAMVSEELVVLLFTEKWLPIVTIMRYNCLYYLATPFMLINVQVFFALGDSSKRVKIELVRLVMLVAGVLIFGIWLDCSMNQLAFVCAVVAVLSALVTFLEVRPMIQYSFKELTSDLINPMISAVLMGFAIYLVDSFLLPVIGVHSNIMTLVIKILVGVAVYALLSIMLKMNGYQEIIRVIPTLVHKREK